LIERRTFMPINFVKAAPIVKPAPPAEPDPKDVPNAEELKAAAKVAVDSLFGDPAPEPEPQPEPAAIAPVEPAAAPEPQPQAEPEPEPEPEPQARPFDAQDLITRTARETAEAMRRPEPAAAPATPEPTMVTFEMSASDAQEYAVLQFLEKQDPAKFSGKAKAFLDYVKSVYDYQDKWEKENPDKTWDPSADEHADWFASNPIPVDKETIENGLIDMKVEQRVEQRFAEKVKPRIDMMDAEKALESARPSIEMNVARGILKLVAVAAPELVALVTAADGKNPNLSTEAVEKVHEADAIAATVLDATAAEIDPILRELEKSTVRDANGNYPFKLQPDKNQIHAIIDGYRWEAENQLRQAPAEVQNVNGRQWVSLEQKAKDFKQIRDTSTGQEQQRKLQEYDARHWTLTIDNVVDLITDDYGKKARNLIQQTDALAKRKYKPEAPPTNGVRPGTQVARPAAPIAPTPAGKPRSPSVASASDIVTTANNGPTPAKTTQQQIIDVMFK